MNIIKLLVVLFWIACIAAWPINAYRLAKCDFQSPYKGEVVHGIGIFFPTFIITAWSDWDN